MEHGYIEVCGTQSGSARYAARLSRIAMAAAVCVAAACASPRAPIYADPALAEVLVHDVVLMPVLDQRADRFGPFEIGRDVRAAAGKILAKKGYRVLTGALLEGGERPPFEGFQNLNARALAQLGPDGSETLLFIGVTAVEQEYGRGGDEYLVRLSGLLVDRASEQVIWRDSGSGTTNFGGLLSVMTPAGSQYDAVYEALVSLFRTVPDRVDRPEGPRRSKS